MLIKGIFRVDFTAEELFSNSKVKMSEDLILIYRTEETLMHSSSTAFKDAFKQIKAAIGNNAFIVIKHIYLLTTYEE